MILLLGREQIMALFLQHSGEIDKKNMRGKTALHLAIENGTFLFQPNSFQVNTKL